MRLNMEMNVPGYGYVNYVDNDFTTYYAPDVVRSIVAVYPHCTVDQKSKLRRILKLAKDAVSKWEIRDDVDARDQKFVLETQLEEV